MFAEFAAKGRLASRWVERGVHSRGTEPGTRSDLAVCTFAFFPLPGWVSVAS